LSALEKVGLLDRRNVLARRLSQGQKRRVGLARLILLAAHHHHKTLWLLDEPTNALDEEGVSLFTGLIRAHLDRGGVACIATHLMLNFNLPVKELNLNAMAEIAQ
jgi:heme exporter protein A